MKKMRPIVLQQDAILGTFCCVPEEWSEELRRCLCEQEIRFALDPPEAGRLGQAGKAVFVFQEWPPHHLASTFRLYGDRKSTRLNSSHRTNSYSVFCLKNKNI